MIDLKNYDYSPPVLHRNAHTSTIIPALVRKVQLPSPYQRERIATPDNDFLDLDWILGSNDKLVIISHGLEGSSDRPYVKGMARAFSLNGFDVIAWNYRGCSEEMNKNLRMYHSGATDDLHTVVTHAQQKDYDKICLVGFSLGGNLTLKYLGEQGDASIIERAVTFSVPLDLLRGSLNISKPKNWIYQKRFLRSLSKKVLAKHKQYPEDVKKENLKRIKTIFDFDDLFTAPIHGFQGARDYYKKCSSRFFVDRVKSKTLVVNALNDPFLPKECLDHKIFTNANSVKFETPKHGGHCGFAKKHKDNLYWSEERAVSFCLE